MICCNITKEKDSVREVSVACLDVKIHIEESEIIRYLKLSSEVERYEYYLSLLERGYKLASTIRTIPLDIFHKLHQNFREEGYKNERLFKKKQLRDYGIKIELNHVLTSYSYNLILSVYDLYGNLIGKNSIYETFPDDIFFNKNVRNLLIDDGKLIVSDFLNHPQFVCSLDDLSRGIVKSVCVNENTKKYIPNEQNAEQFERLKWK